MSSESSDDESISIESSEESISSEDDDSSIDDGRWKWGISGFQDFRVAGQDLPKIIAPDFSKEVDLLDAKLRVEEEKDVASSSNRRKLMENVTAQIAQYNLLEKRNERAVAKKKEYQYYEIPRLFIIRPVMEEDLVLDLIEKNKKILEQLNELIHKNEELAKLDTMELVEYAE